MSELKTILANPGKSVVGVSSTREPWQLSMQSAIRSGRELYHLLGLEAQWTWENEAAEQDFSIFVPHEFLARIRPGDPVDPLLRQVLPAAAELSVNHGFSADPVGDQAASRLSGVLQKYAGRVLLITTGACAVHCRYCFRRHYPYSEGSMTGSVRESTLKLLAADPSIEEVLLSGGDPLTLTDQYLKELVMQLEAIGHLRRVRFHTRVPIMIPSRVTDGLLRILTQTRLTPWFVVHINHPQELDEATLASLGRLVDAGIPVMNQAVLLRGVNDSVEVLAELCKKLVNHRVTPYYLHQLDRVAGAEHFEVPVETGLRIMEQLRRVLPGYAVPQYVTETAGKPYKEVLA